MKDTIYFMILIVVLFAGRSSFANEENRIFNSLPDDKFSVWVPENWSEKNYPATGGRTYAFWNDMGNAITITVKKPNSFKSLLGMISKNEVSKDQLLELEQYMRQEAPAKLDLRLGIETIASQKAFSQNHITRQETFGVIYYLNSIRLYFLYKGMMYDISFSASVASNKKAARSNMENSINQFFKPILLTFFLY